MIAFIINMTSAIFRKARYGSVPQLFDRAFYLKNYPDVISCGLDPYLHYIIFGARKGYNPSPFFDTAFYLDQVGFIVVDVLSHYVDEGVGCGYDPNPSFSTFDYLAEHADVRESGINPLLHYIKWGRYEGRCTFRSIRDRDTAGPASQTSLGIDDQVTPAVSGPVVALCSNQNGLVIAFGAAIPDDVVWRAEDHVALAVALQSKHGDMFSASLREAAIHLRAGAMRVSVQVRELETYDVGTNSFLIVFRGSVIAVGPSSVFVRFGEGQLYDQRTGRNEFVTFIPHGVVELSPVRNALKSLVF